MTDCPVIGLNPDSVAVQLLDDPSFDEGGLRLLKPHVALP